MRKSPFPRKIAKVVCSFRACGDASCHTLVGWWSRRVAQCAHKHSSYPSSSHKHLHLVLHAADKLDLLPSTQCCSLLRSWMLLSRRLLLGGVAVSERKVFSPIKKGSARLRHSPDPAPAMATNRQPRGPRSAFAFRWGCTQRVRDIPLSHWVGQDGSRRRHDIRIATAYAWVGTALSSAVLHPIRTTTRYGFLREFGRPSKLRGTATGGA